MTAAECEIVADAACHLRALRDSATFSEDAQKLTYVLGMLGTLPIEPEPTLFEKVRRASEFYRAKL